MSYTVGVVDGAVRDPGRRTHPALVAVLEVTALGLRPLR
jgi:hypothetical protein